MEKPQQYRPLAPDETIQKGDEWKTRQGLECCWGAIPLHFQGVDAAKISSLSVSGGFQFRRPIPTVAKSATGDPVPQAKIEYVLGFGFSAGLDRVVLIRKAKPDWQRGKLNGIGGKIEDESKYTAMVREFREECGCKTHGEQWSYFCRMEGKDFDVHCFATVIDPAECRTTEIEKVEEVRVSEIKYLQKEMIENLPWLIHLAVDHMQDNRPLFTVASYEAPDLKAEEPLATDLDESSDNSRSFQEIKILGEEVEMWKKLCRENDADLVAMKLRAEKAEALRETAYSARDAFADLYTKECELRRQAERERDDAKAKLKDLADFTAELSKECETLKLDKQISESAANIAKKERDALRAELSTTKEQLDCLVPEYVQKAIEAGEVALRAEVKGLREAIRDMLIKAHEKCDEETEMELERIAALAGKGDK